MIQNLIFSYFYNIFLIIPSILILIYIYRKRGTGERILFSSTFILKQLQSTKTQAKKFKPPLRILLELLILSLLILGVIHPQSFTANTKIAILIDNSLSMAANFDNQSRLSAAIDYAKKFPSADIFFSNPNLKKVLKNNLDQINISYSNANINLAVQDLKKGDYTKIIIISDVNYSEKSGDLELVSVRPKDPARLNNLALKLKSQNSSTVKLELISYSDQASMLDLTFKKLNLKQELISSENSSYELAAYEQKEISFNPGEFELLEISLTTKTLLSNNLINDDFIYLTKDVNLKKIGLLSSKSSSELGLNQLPGYEFINIKNLQDQEYQGYLIFQEQLDIQPKLPSILIYSKSPNCLLTESADNKLIKLDLSHPVSKYLDPLNLDLTTNFGINSKESQTIFSGKNLPIITSAEINKNIFACLAFDPFPFKQEENIINKIIILNLFNYVYNSKLELKENIIPGFHQLNSKISSSNYFDSYESNLRSEEKLETLKLKTEQTLKSINPVLSSIILVLLALDLVLWLRRSNVKI